MWMPRPVVTAAFAALLLPTACGERPEDGPYARAGVVGGLDETIGGVKGIGRPGDFRLENQHFRAILLSGRTSMGPGLYGGSIVDADLQWNDPAVSAGNGRDQFTEMFPTVNLNVPFSATEESVWVEEDGSSGRAVVRAVGQAEPFITLLHALWGLVRMPSMWMVTDYIAEPGVPWMTIRTTVSFQDNAEPVAEGEPVDYPTEGLDVVQFGLQDGVIMGDFFLSGGSLDVFAPGIGFDEDGAVFRANEEGLNTFEAPFEFPFLAAVGEGISYGIVPSDGIGYVPLFTASQTVMVAGAKEGDGTAQRFSPDTSLTYERMFLVGQGDVGSIVDQYVDIREIPYGTVRGNVLEQGTNVGLEGVDVLVFEPGAEYPWSQWRTDVRPDDDLLDGSFEGRLPVGTWELLVHEQGRPDRERLTVEVTEGGETNVRFEALRPGVVSFVIRDETGERVPAKLSVFKADPTSLPPNRVPAFGDPFIAGDPEWVLFEDDGQGEFAVPPGEYYVVASRGLEYEIDVSEPFLVDENRGHFVELQVIRSIETDGWISADLHVHSAPSHDSGVTLPMRLRTMVAEGVEFFAATDHDQLTDFAPWVEDMGLEEWVQTSVGVETTTIELGHYLAFPMQRDFLGDVGGAADWTGMSPVNIVEALREQGADAGTDPLVFVAHPRDGILGYFDQYGFDPYAGEVGSPVFEQSLIYGVPRADGSPVNPLITPGNVTLDMDALELFTGKRVDLHRTPTQPELDGFSAGDGTDVVDWFTRTLEEQDALDGDVYRLAEGIEGNIDDWFALLNLGYRFTAIGNSDTHGLTSTEAGCPRNYVMSETDDPAFIEDQAVADAVKNHQVVVSYGPFLRMWVEGAGVGSDVAADGAVDIDIEVQAPSWIDVDRVELYENAKLIAEWTVEDSGSSNLRFFESFEANPVGDAWYVAIAMGDGGLQPVATAVEIPYIPLDEAVTGALGSLEIVASLLGEPVPFPKAYDIYPYAMTNPIWVDVDGGGFQASGQPSWLRPPGG
jgi:hypothetical protein